MKTENKLSKHLTKQTTEHGVEVKFREVISADNFSQGLSLILELLCDELIEGQGDDDPT